MGHTVMLRLARKHGIADEDILQAVEHTLAVGEQDDGKVLCLGPDRAANLLEVVSVVGRGWLGDRDSRDAYARACEPFDRGEADSDA